MPGGTNGMGFHISHFRTLVFRRRLPCPSPIGPALFSHKLPRATAKSKGVHTRTDEPLNQQERQRSDEQIGPK